MGNVDYDKKKFVRDAYGNLYVKPIKKNKKSGKKQ
jgi:hypothetical protein